MWPSQQQQPSSQTTNISPHLLNHFNIYEVLEPQKAPMNVENQIDKLIDIDDSSDITSSLTPDYDRMRNFDLVDLFQNIFVSPQHITKQKEVKNDEINANIDYKDFFDKLETGKKIDWTRECNDCEEGYNVNSLPIKPKALESDEKIDRTKVCKDGEVEFNIDDIPVKPKVLVPTIDLESDSDPEDLMDKIIMKNITYQMGRRSVKSNYDVNCKSHNIINTDCGNIHFADNVDDCKAQLSQKYRLKKDLADAKDIRHLNSQINNSLNDSSFIVKAIVKDEKLYRKRRNVKPDHVKANFIKGPDIKEKCIVLPQIMKRLTERRISLDEEKSWRKRFILDSGSSKNSIASCSNCCKCSEVKSTSTESTKRGFVMKSEKATEMLTSKYMVPSDTFNLSSLPTQSSSKFSPQISTNSMKSNKTKLGTFEPVVLMKDCNRERLLAWKRGEMIKNLMRTGKF